MKDRSSDLVRNVLGVLFGVMIAASLWILRPFLPALIWATLLVVATWPVMLAVQRRLRGRRGLAVVVMTAALLLVVIIPVALVVTTLVDNAADLAGDCMPYRCQASPARPPG